MIVAILSESASDEAAIRILVEAILGHKTQPARIPRLDTRRGLAAVQRLLPVAIKHVYFQTRARGLIVVIDSDGSEPHEASHDVRTHPKCRLCLLRKSWTEIRSGLRQVTQRGPFDVAFGLAIPGIEAWYSCGRIAGIGEQAWRLDRQSGVRAKDRLHELKRKLYVVDRPSLGLATQRAIVESKRLAADLEQLERQFPAGFGSLVRDLRAW